MNSRPCAICAHPATQKCSACKRTYYCSREHQQLAWPKHKGLCKIYRMDNPPDPAGSYGRPVFESVADVLGTYCGLCGKQERLTRTNCCNRPICDDSDSYRPFSYARNSCYRNHDRYTLCSTHKTEHPQETCDWRDCVLCKNQVSDLESYVGFGTSSCNFAEDEWNPPTFEPSYCFRCRKMIKLNSEGYTKNPDGTTSCQGCAGRR